METLRLKPRKPVEDDVENWDDDDFLIDCDDLALRNPSAMGNPPPHRRDSLSSHVSVRSELESLLGEEERVVHLPGEDERSTSHAIAVAATAGIPIPSSVPSTALVGTIKRLGGRKVRKILQEDWGDDLELPEGVDGLRIKTQDPNSFPQALRQVSSSNPSPSKPLNSPPALQPGQSSKISRPTLGAPINLERFRDRDDDDDLFGDGSETIKVSKTRQLNKPALPRVIAKMAEPHRQAENDYEQDLELPSDGTLKLSSRRDIPKTPVSAHDDFDWGEGSLGTRFGGTRRDGRSNRSSSASAFSPSISSSITAESEDEAQLDGIELPHGPLDLRERLRRKRQNRSPERTIEEEPAPPPRSVPQPEADTRDFFLDLNVGDGSVFDSGKLKLHTNVKLKSSRPTSPVRPKTAVSLTFTNKPVQTSSRLPRPTSSHHERTLTQSSLEPVPESGGPIVSRPTRRPQSRLGHMSQSSQSSTASGNTPSTTSAPTYTGPTTPQKRQIGQKSSTVSLRNEPTTTNAQLLRLKRSLPAMRPPGSPARPMTGRAAERPPSRTEAASRPTSGIRPKTPVDRTRRSFGENSAAQARKPFLPAGGSSLQSCNVNAKRQLRRHDSDLSNDTRPTSRAVSRSTVRSPSPAKRDRKLEKLARAGVRLPLSLPKRPRHFGDGHELDAFDDLPTSARTESEFVKQPKYPSPQYPTQFRNKVMQHLLLGRTSSPAPSSPHSPARPDYQPRFARDTASSRIARETNLAHRVPSSGQLAPLTSQRVAQLSTRSNLHQPQPSVKPKRAAAKKQPQLKPHLIANLNSSNESKMVNGMFYNPETFQWEGNDNVLNSFDVPASSPSTVSVPPFSAREKENATPRPALITNISTTKGVQVVGGMVFDPQNMCWLKLGPQSAQSEITDPLEGFNAIDDEDDVFKGIPDLDDNTADTAESGRVSEVKDDWLVGEEFDVGPEFIRRQREEEDRWRKKCERWLGLGNRDREAWRWTIRGVIIEATER
ncbi:cytokinesis regulator [Diaporthe helianthi]|uniref:Cytokinesis regulator n=1 Tax=Diaporthe helianthi TaxID=158607 RepID=A0A2P5HS09_DIAHE|nr:cytokinesis regulator [Diaporthe helianthi]